MPATRVHVLVLPAVNVLDLSGPVQVLHTANHHGGRYEIGFVASRVEERSAQGLALAGGDPGRTRTACPPYPNNASAPG